VESAGPRTVDCARDEAEDRVDSRVIEQMSEEEPLVELRTARPEGL
jgi:hypothetical protein